MKKFKIILITVIITIAIVIAFLNKQEVKTNLIFTTIELPHMLLTTITFAVGFFAGLIVASLLRRKTPKIKKT
jgi:uncharacterized membrane protein YciS (DUF1049 family)